MVEVKRSIFDLLKIGIGPSSSHTLGPMSMGIKFREECLLDLLKPSRLEVTLKGSLAHTGEGHLTPNAIIAGLAGLNSVTSPIDKIKAATVNVVKHGISLGEYSLAYDKNWIIFDRKKRDFLHPNTAVFRAFDHQNKLVLVREYCSIGGGAFVEASQLSSSSARNSNAKLSFSKILRDCKKLDLSLIDWLYKQESRLSGESRKVMRERLRQLWKIMQECVDLGLTQSGKLPGKLGVRRRAKKLYKSLKEQSSDFQKSMTFIARAEAYALAVSEENACGGRVITAPTCGACGVLPAVLTMLVRDQGMSEELTLDGLALAGLIGNIVVDRASISGAEVGCQGEVGVASAMASAACCFLNGGSNSQIEQAAEMGLEHHLGLTCDPIMGLVQVPCIERNAVAAGTAINTASLALLGSGNHLVSFDSCVDTMKATGDDMLEKYKETSLGGLATTHC
jgi:L-serine dehydratase